MMRLLACLFVLFGMCAGTAAQNDSIALAPGAAMPDAVYLSYRDFRFNNGISKNQIISNIGKEQLEFMGKAMSAELLVYKIGDSTYKINPSEAWGFFQNRALYLNYQKEFYRVPVFGSISYLVAAVVITNSSFFDPRFGATVAMGNTREIREFIMDYYTGVMEELTLEKLEILLSRDTEIFAEFSKLKKSKKKDEMYRYIRRYNDRHPIYFLK